MLMLISRDLIKKKILSQKIKVKGIKKKNKYDSKYTKIVPETKTCSVSVINKK